LAFSYGYHARGELTLLQIGSEPEASVAGVGRVLLGELLADSFERGDRVVDLGPGDLPYQRALRTAAETTYAVDAPLPSARRGRWPRFSRGRGV
jgi:CelD/BcsL family acetyltransferase involved in cellulose biosynthesis